MDSKHIAKDGVIVADCFGDSIQYRLKNLICYFDGKKCSRYGWCVRRSKKYNIDGSRLRLMDICPRYPSDSSQTRL